MELNEHKTFLSSNSLDILQKENYSKKNVGVPENYCTFYLI